MKVDSSQSLRPSGRTTSGRSKAASGQFARSMEGAEAAGTAAHVSSTGSIAGLDALLSIQGVDAPEEREERAKSRAHSILDQLEEMRVDLLTGRVPVGRLQQIAEMVGKVRDHVDDSRLSLLLDDVDLRARVELAKWGVDAPGLPS